MFKKIRSIFILGFLTLAPIAFTLWFLIFITKKTDLIFGSSFIGQGILIVLLVLFVTGLLAKTFFGRFFHRILDWIISKVPFIRTFYTTIKQTFNLILSEDSKTSFKEVVMVNYPTKESHCLAFVTSELSDNKKIVFVPTAPNPTSGFVIICDNSNLIATDISVEEAIKLIISCGTLGQNYPQIGKLITNNGKK